MTVLCLLMNYRFSPCRVTSPTFTAADSLSVQVGRHSRSLTFFHLRVVGKARARGSFLETRTVIHSMVTVGNVCRLVDSPCGTSQANDVGLVQSVEAQ